MTLTDFIKNGRRFLVAGHREPDGDCIGSQLALASVLRRMGKEAVLCAAGPFKRIEIKSYEHLFTLQPDKKEGDMVILVDCTGLDRAGDLMPVLEGLPLALIDHHTAGFSGDFAAGPVYVDAAAPSTTFLIYKLILDLGLEPTREEAEYLFFGLCTDTGFFRHVDSEGAAAFETAAALIRLGASPKSAFADIYGHKSLDSRRLLGIVLARTESLFDGKLLLSTEEHEETCRFGQEGRDSDSLYQLLQTVDGAEAVVIIRQDDPENCTVGFRSRGWVDVGNIAKSFGGGGHKNAAGLSIPGTIAVIKPKIIKAFDDIFNPIAKK